MNINTHPLQSLPFSAHPFQIRERLLRDPDPDARLTVRSSTGAIGSAFLKDRPGVWVQWRGCTRPAELVDGWYRVAFNPAE